MEVVALLLAAQADPKAEEHQSGFTPLHVASEGGHQTVVARLLESDADATAGGSSSSGAAGGNTPLHGASMRGHREVVCFLLQAKADARAKDKEKGITALHGASEFGHSAVVPLLLDAHADPNAQDEARLQQRRAARRHACRGRGRRHVDGERAARRACAAAPSEVRARRSRARPRRGVISGGATGWSDNGNAAANA